MPDFRELRLAAVQLLRITFHTPVNRSGSLSRLPTDPLREAAFAFRPGPLAAPIAVDHRSSTSPRPSISARASHHLLGHHRWYVHPRAPQARVLAVGSAAHHHVR